MTELNTSYIRRQIERLQAGDTAARDELIAAAMERLEKLARKMLKSYPAVARWEETPDIVQQASIRLMRALEQVPVASQRDFFGLAAAQIRRELLDLARHYRGPCGLGSNHHSGGELIADCHPAEADTDLERWAEFHAAVERLPDRVREAFMLSYYQGRTQPEIAELLGVNERTVRRWYMEAQVHLGRQLGGDFI